MYNTFFRIMHSASQSIQSAFHYLGISAIITIAFAILMIILMKATNKKIDVKRILKYSFSVFYVCFLLEMTLFKRIGVEQSAPFSSLWLGWSIFEIQYAYNVTFSPIINILMFIPLSLVTKFVFNIKDKFILKTTICAFFFSLFIELSQAIFHLGTFQIADLVYNSLSGLIGGILLEIIIKAYKNNRKH